MKENEIDIWMLVDILIRKKLINYKDLIKAKKRQIAEKEKENKKVGKV